MRITIDREFSSKTLGDILVTAFDGDYGGSWYWAEPAEENWLKTQGDEWSSVHVKEQESSTEQERTFVITHETVLKGIQKLFEPEVLPGRSDIRKELLDETPAPDADQSDVIIQLGLFGEVIYG